MTELERDLAGVVGAAQVLTDPGTRLSYETDWTGRYRGRARLVVRPASAEEVCGVLRVCSAAGVPVVPQGGNTGLVGGGVPRDGEVVLSLTRLDSLGPVDALAGQVTVGAGATLAAVARHVAAAGFEVGVDLAARDTATIGGMVCTNAGGLRVVRHGSMRARVAGLAAVLADGRVLRRLDGLPKDSTGYDLVGALVGSEGTLAVVTAVRLRLVTPDLRTATALLAVADTAAAQGVLAAVRSSVGGLTSAEICYEDGVRLVCAHRGLAPPFATAYPAYLLLECGGPDPLPELAAAVEARDEVLDAAVAVGEADRRRLWAYREGHTDAVASLGTPLKLDVGVPAAELAGFELELRELVAPARLVLFGHLAEGNYHANVLGAADPEGLTDAVLKAVAARGGTISAEHGVGVAKARWLSLVRSPVELSLMAAVKRAWDPAGLLNPGVLLAG